MTKLSGLRPLLLALLAGALVLATPTLASAQAADALSENASPAVKEQTATGYASRINRGCTISRHVPRIRVTCSRNEYFSFTYEFRVRGKAISFRSMVPVSESGAGTSSSFGHEGFRSGARSYTVQVGGNGRGTWEFDTVRIRYKLPTTFDKRPCVTPGEWARMSPWKGGMSGTSKKYAAVFETSGKQRTLSAWTAGYRYQVRAYRKCGSSKKVKVTFHQYRGTPGWWAYWG